MPPGLNNLSPGRIYNIYGHQLFLERIDIEQSPYELPNATYVFKEVYSSLLTTNWRNTVDFIDLIENHSDLPKPTAKRKTKTVNTSDEITEIDTSEWVELL